MKSIIRIIRLLSVLMPLFHTATAQPETWDLSGRVVDGNSDIPLAGVTIRISDGTMVQTDAEGMFRLLSPLKEISLDFTLVGYDTEKVDIRFPVTDTVLVRLRRQDNLLQEVVISTGYQQISQERITGSFEQIGPALLERSTGSDILSRIEDLTSSVYFDYRHHNFNAAASAGHQITMHGISSLRGSQANLPLIILDNFPYDGDISNINPNDIETVTILKDAAASSIWGARAGNGVIVLTSKNPGYGSRFNLTFDHQTTVRAKPDLFARSVIDNADLIEIEEFLFSNGYYTAKENNRAKPALPQSVETLIKVRDGQISEEEGALILRSLGGHDIRHDLLDHVYRNAAHQQFAVTLSRGTDGVASSISIGHDRTANTLRESSDHRTTARLTNNFLLGKGIDLRTNVRWAQTDQRRPTPESIEYTNLGHSYPYSRLMDEDGNHLPIPYRYRMEFLDTAGAGRLLDWHYRPLDEMGVPARTMRHNEITGNVDLTVSIVSWLSANFRYQFQSSKSHAQDLSSLDSYHSRDQINRGTAFTGEGVIYNYPYGATIQRTEGAGTIHNGRAQLNIHRNWSAQHEFSAMGGFDIGQDNHQASNFRAYGFDPATLTYSNNVQHGQRYPVFANLSASGNVPYPISSFNEQVSRYVSVFSNASYTYADRYTVYASARRDASNLFGVATNDKWTPLWSVGAAWIANRESFLNNEWLDLLKLRGSYGLSGNVDNSMSGVTTLIYLNNAASTLVPYPSADIRNPPNPELRWELVNKLNIGADFGFFNRRLSGSFDWYIKNTRDLFALYPLDATTGVAFMTMNVANTRSRGFDLRLNGLLVDRAFNWRVEGLLSYNNNWIVNSYMDYNGPSSAVSAGSLSRLEGTIAYPLYSYPWGGLDPETGEPRGLLNGEVSTDFRTLMSSEVSLDQLVFHGSARPLYFGSIRNDFSYRNISLSFAVTYRLGHYFRRPGLDYDRLFANADGHRDYYSRWRQPGDEMHTHVPALQYPVEAGNTYYTYSEVLVEKADHVRLRDIRLEYTMRDSLIRSGSQLRFFLYLADTGIFWSANKQGLDPEGWGNIPKPTGVSLGVNFTIQ